MTEPSPLIAITPWRRSLPTYVHPENDLYTLDPEYTDSVEAAGGLAVITPFASSLEHAKALLARCDGLILSGGDDIDPSTYGHELDGSVAMNPATDASDQHFLAAALELGLPTLAVCRGAQLVNVALGGTLNQHIWDTLDDHPARPETDDETHNADAMWARRHDVTLESGSCIAKVFDSSTVSTTSLHHQSIDEVAPNLVVTGRTSDGSIEAVEHRTHPLVGVQWHPERQGPDGHHVLFEWLVGAAADEANTSASHG